jgi:hypothetical protein
MNHGIAPAQRTNRGGASNPLDTLMRTRPVVLTDAELESAIGGLGETLATGGYDTDAETAAADARMTALQAEQNRRAGH